MGNRSPARQLDGAGQTQPPLSRMTKINRFEFRLPLWWTPTRKQCEPLIIESHLRQMAVGIRGGRVPGESDENGLSPLAEGFSPADVAASFYYSLVIDHTKEYHTNTRRPITIVRDGTIIEDLFAKSSKCFSRVCAIAYAGQARNAISATLRSSSRLAPLVACTAIPCDTLTTYLARSAGSQSAGRSPSETARSKRFLSPASAAPASLDHFAANGLSRVAASQPLCTRKHPRGLRESVIRSMLPNHSRSTTARAVGSLSACRRVRRVRRRSDRSPAGTRPPCCRRRHTCWGG